VIITFNDIKDFYPTPQRLIEKMLDKVEFEKIRTVLEPSAGKGNIIDAVISKTKSISRGFYRERKCDIDCIEINPDLQMILKGKNLRVVHNDFLTFQTYKKYSLIVMNPPFSEGDKHLLKAIEMQQQGGQIVCLLNSETIKNPFSNTRKDLVRKLDEYNAEIEYIQDAFKDAENKTGVEIALIYINIPNSNRESIILNNLKKEEQYRTEQKEQSNIVEADFIERIIKQYNFEIKAGLNLISEYKNIQPLVLKSFKDDFYKKDSIIQLKVDNRHSNENDILENQYIKDVRYKYWETLFSSKEFNSLLTSNLRQDYMNKINELAEYDFSYYNIKQIQLELSKHMSKGVEDTILTLFEEFSYKYYWYETSKNIHYFNGWKSNSCYKINKKVIIPLDAFNGLCGEFNCTRYDVPNKLSDIEKVFNYLDGNLTKEISLQNALEEAEKNSITRNISTKYFNINFYKKGTCHLTFKNEELLKKFNIFGCSRKGWLPPSYGKKKYTDMSKEEKQVINEFEGKEEYQKILNNKKYYIFSSSKVLQITEG
jgi:hypothetical protein